MSRLAVCLALLVLTSACAPGDPAVPSGGHAADVLQWGVAGLTDLPTLDPALASDPVSLSASSLIYGGLVSLDSKLRVRPDGASHWSVAGAGRVYTFYLRHNLRFPDGRRVTAADFAAALERALGPDGSSGTAPFYLGLIAQRASSTRRGPRTLRGISVVNRWTLRLSLTHPAPYFLAELAFPASYVPDMTLVRRFGPSWTDHAAGFGPYFVRQWRHGRSLTLARNPYYYAGKPTFKTIALHFYQDTGRALAAYRAGRIDVISGLPAGTALTPSPAGTLRVPALALDYLAFNTARLPFHHLNARRAFAAVALRSLHTPAGPGTVPAAGLLPSAFRLATPHWHPSRSPAAYLARAGYPRARGFPPVTFVVPHDAEAYAVAQRLRDAWHRSLHVTVLLRELEPSNYGTVLNAKAFDLALVRWGADYSDPQDFLGTQLGASSDNITSWSPRSYNALLQRADTLSPGDQRRALLLRQAAALAASKLPLLPLDQPAQTAVIRPALHGIYLTPLGTVVGNWRRARFAS